MHTGPARGPFFIDLARAFFGSTFQSGRHILVFRRELHASGERHRFHERREIFVQVSLRIRLQRGMAEMTLQQLTRSRRNRHWYVHLSAELKSELESLPDPF